MGASLRVGVILAVLSAIPSALGFGFGSRPALQSRRGLWGLRSTTTDYSQVTELTLLKETVLALLSEDKASWAEEPLLYNLGTLLLQTEEQTPESQSEALGYFEMAARLNPNRDASWFNIAMLREAKSDVEGSLDAYAKAIAVTQDAKTAIACFNNKVGLLLAQDRIDDAARVADISVNAYPDDPMTWTSMGVVLRVNGNDAIAVTCFENALLRGTDDKCTVALNNLGMLYAKVGRSAEAASMFNRALEVNPADLATLKALATLYADTGAPSEAAACLRRAIALDPHDNQLLFQLTVVENTWPLTDPTSSSERSPFTPVGSAPPVEAVSAAAAAEAAAATTSTSTSVGAPSAAAIPREYVADLFDFYAQSGYDAHMRETLQYKGPELLWDVFASPSVEPRGRSTLADYRTIELGVGSGLCGSFFRTKGLGGDIVGCDLSPAMIQSAMRAEVMLNHAHELVYRSVAVSDAADFLDAHARVDADLILAADVLCYLGDLRALFKKARFALKTNGIFLFSVEELLSPLPAAAAAAAAAAASVSASAAGGSEGGAGSEAGAAAASSTAVPVPASASAATAAAAAKPQPPHSQQAQAQLQAQQAAQAPPFSLHSHGRFAHSQRYIFELAARVGFDVVELKRTQALRVDGDVPVPALVVALRASDLSGSGAGGEE